MNKTVKQSIDRANLRRFRQKTAKSLVTEAHVQQTCVELLEHDGWRAFRTEMTVQKERGRVVGEIGQPDYLFIRYGVVYTKEDMGIKVDGAALWTERRDEVLWIEFKAPGKTPDAHQKLWHDAERQRGALVLVVDDIDRFISFYKSSGLARRV